MKVLDIEDAMAYIPKQDIFKLRLSSTKLLQIIKTAEDKYPLKFIDICYSQSRVNDRRRGDTIV